MSINLYTDGSKAENRVATAATSNNLSAQVRLPGNASIFTAELQALKLAFNIIKNCDWDHFIIFTDSLSSLQALDSNNCDHPFIQDILKLFNDCLSVNNRGRYRISRKGGGRGLTRVMDISCLDIL